MLFKFGKIVELFIISEPVKINFPFLSNRISSSPSFSDIKYNGKTLDPGEAVICNTQHLLPLNVSVASKFNELETYALSF
jgi:hypothetical protein